MKLSWNKVITNPMLKHHHYLEHKDIVGPWRSYVIILGALASPLAGFVQSDRNAIIDFNIQYFKTRS
jgi:hypothetical protein